MCLRSVMDGKDLAGLSSLADLPAVGSLRVLASSIEVSSRLLFSVLVDVRLSAIIAQFCETAKVGR